MVKKKTEKVAVKERTPKQYTIFHTIGGDPEFFVSEGDDYRLATIDIQSMHTGEVYAHPVIFVIDKEADTIDLIPFAAVGKLRYNWGAAEETKKFITDPELIKKKMETAQKKRKEKALPDKITENMIPKESNDLRQYG